MLSNTCQTHKHREIFWESYFPDMDVMDIWYVCSFFSLKVALWIHPPRSLSGTSYFSSVVQNYDASNTLVQPKTKNIGRCTCFNWSFQTILNIGMYYPLFKENRGMYQKNIGMYYPQLSTGVFVAGFQHWFSEGGPSHCEVGGHTWCRGTWVEIVMWGVDGGKQIACLRCIKCLPSDVHPPKSNIDIYQKWCFFNCISFQIWLCWVSMLVFGGVYNIHIYSHMCEHMHMHISIAARKMEWVWRAVIRTPLL